jgi:hypothetical protein
MAHKTNNRKQTIKKLRRYLNLDSPSWTQKKKSIFYLINKEEDEDNEQTLWPFSGRSLFRQLSFR